MIRIEFVGDNGVCSKYETWAKRQFPTVDGRRFYHTGECIVHIFNDKGNGFIQIIAEYPAGIITYPKTGDSVKETETGITITDGNSFTENKDRSYKAIPNTELSNVGGGDASFLFKYDGEWGSENLPLQYGNASQVGSDGDVISWLSNPSPGLPSQDAGSAFSDVIFNKGIEMVKAPGKVLGAAYNSSGVLLCVYMLGGYSHVAKRVNKEWVDLVSTTGDKNTPCFFSDGKFSFPDGSYFEVTDSSTTYHPAASDAVGTHVESGSIFGAYSSGSDLIIGEDATRLWNKIQLVASNKSKTTSTSSITSTNGTFPVYKSGPFANQIQIAWSGNTIGASNLNGMVCNYQWSVPSGVNYHFDEVNDPHHRTLLYDGMSGCVLGNIYAYTEVAMSNKLPVYQGVTWTQIGQEGSCYSYCNDYSMPIYYEDVYVTDQGGFKDVYWVYWNGWITTENYRDGTCESEITAQFKGGGGIPVWNNNELIEYVTGVPYKTGPGKIRSEPIICNPGCGDRWGYFSACGVCGSCLVGLCYSSNCVIHYKAYCP